MKSTELVLPVSSELALVGTFEGGAPSHLDASRELVAFANTRTLAFAKRQIYASSRTFEFVGPDLAVYPSAHIHRYWPWSVSGS